MHNIYKQWLEDGRPKVICSCGCNEEIIITWRHEYQGIPKYLHGHHCRIYSIPESYKKWLGDGKPKVYCNCDRHEEIIITKKHRHTGIPQYKHGHHTYNKPCSENTKQKIGRGNTGKIFTEDHKEKLSKQKIGITGDKAGNWIDGRSFEPYCKKFNESLKEEIRERDNRICQECGKIEINNKRKLDVHHIHYDKENCYPDLISLCQICNVKSNKNRDYWEEHFMIKLKERNLCKQ